jgi:hypothetical protein
MRGYTHALPITPQASFATAPFSFNFDQIPGLYVKKKVGLRIKTIASLEITHIPKNFLLFKKLVAFVTYTVPIACNSSTPKLSNLRSSASRRMRVSHAPVSSSPAPPGLFASTNGRKRSTSFSVSIRTRASRARLRSRSCASSFARCSGVSLERFLE